MKANMVRKTLVCGIIVLFIGTGIIPLVGSLSTEKEVLDKIRPWGSNLRDDDDTTPPVTTIALDPPTPDGENGWYVSDVDACLHATDDLSGVKAIYYRIDGGEWKNHSGEFLYFRVVEDGEHVVEYYSVDNAGNEEEVKSAEFKMDQEEPEGGVTYKKVGFRKVKFTVDAYDETSGINRVEFYWGDELQHIDYEPPYEWVFTTSSAKNKAALPIFFPFYIYDNAGNVASAIGNDPISKNIYNNLNQKGSQRSSSDLGNIEIYAPSGSGIGTSKLGDDVTPPVTTHELDPAEPDGENGYYVSNVTITLNATDDVSGVNATYYLKDIHWIKYTGPFTITSSYKHLIFYYSVDNAGNVEDIKKVEFKIDKKPPRITLFYERLPRKLRFIAICHDYNSGIDRVEFCTVLGDLLSIDYDEPYEWIWIFKSKGMVVTPYPLGPELGIMAVAYDKAGNSAYDVIDDISPYPISISRTICGSSSQISQHSLNPMFLQILGGLLNLQ